MQRVSWGLIGCGDVARKRVALAIQQDSRSRLLAACRRQPALLRQFCDRFEVARPYTAAEDLIADASVDAVYIATPVREHLPQTLAAAAAGKHVLVEKPMALSTAECDRMIEACRAAGVKLGVAYYRRFYPLVDRIKQLIDDDVIGQPLTVSAVTSTPMAMQQGQEGDWRWRPEEGGGGALMDVGSHRIDLFRYLFGEVASVKAFCESYTVAHQAEDTAVLLMKFQAPLAGTLQCHFGTTIDPDEFAILGTRGRLSARPLNGHELVVQEGSSVRVEHHPPPSNFSSPLVADFVAAILDGGEPAVTGEDARRTNQVIELAYRDARTSVGQVPSGGGATI